MIAEPAPALETIDLLPTEEAPMSELPIDPEPAPKVGDSDPTQPDALFMDTTDAAWLRTMLIEISKTTTSANHFLRRLVEIAEEREKRESAEHRLSLDRRKADLQAELNANELEHESRRRAAELKVERERWLRQDVTRPAMAAGTVLVTMAASRLGLFPGWLGDLLAMLFGGP